MFFLHIKSSPNLLFGVLCLPGDQSHPFVQPSINPLARCICWAGLLGRVVFPPWNEGPNFGSYTITSTGDINYSELHTEQVLGLPLWLAGKESTCSAGDLGSILELRRSPGEGKA